jgi:hypothetical protein
MSIVKPSFLDDDPMKVLWDCPMGPMGPASEVLLAVLEIRWSGASSEPMELEKELLCLDGPWS